LPPLDKALIRGSIIDVSERRQAELRQLMMARELDHRVKNNLAEVLALAEQTGMSSRTVEEFRETFSGRVRAMARTHEALAARHWKGVPLLEVVELTLSPYDVTPDDRIVRSGAAVMLGPSASSALCMTLHELAANAAKYGALAVAGGRVDLTWRRIVDGSLKLDWRESGGPPVARPEREGFGTRLVQGVVSHELGGTATIDFHVTGVCCQIVVPPEHLDDAGGDA
jgi:two-component sensor histidine kinase